MGCGCGQDANAAAKFLIKWTDGTVSKKYDDEPEARLALAASGKTGVIKRA